MHCVSEASRRPEQVSKSSWASLVCQQQAAPFVLCIRDMQLCFLQRKIHRKDCRCAHGTNSSTTNQARLQAFYTAHKTSFEVIPVSCEPLSYWCASLGGGSMMKLVKDPTVPEGVFNTALPHPLTRQRCGACTQPVLHATCCTLFRT